MTNLDSSWESSVVKLAQLGNAQALTFWINRYLVPRGICAQVMAEQPGCLLIRIMCHRVPDGDRLLHFIYQKFHDLNSEVIRSVRITAQMVGSSDILWERSTQIPATAKWLHSANQFASDWLSSDNSGSARPLQKSVQAAPIPTPSILAAPIPIPPPLTRSQPVTNPYAAPRQTVPQAQQQTLRLAAFSPPSSRPSQQRASVARTQTIPQKIAALKTRTARSATQVVHWFIGQTPRTRTLILGSSAVAAFSLGCGFEMLGHYTTALLPRPSGTAGIFSGNSVHKATVQTAIGEVPVVQQASVNPNDPSITLMFSSVAALGHSLTGHEERRADYQAADVMMTSLNYPLSSTPASSGWADKNLAAYNTASPGDADARTDSQGSSADNSDSGDAQTPQATLQDLQASGVNVVNLAGVQTTTPGTAPLAQTVSLLNRNTIHPVGAGQDAQTARRPEVFEVKGKRIAYLAYSDPTLSTALTEAAGIGRADLSAQIAEDIKAIRNQVDWVVVSFRWNRQLKAYPEDWQIKFTHAAIDDGADLVVGYQPGSTQGAEVYHGRAIAYSLGDDIDEYNDNSKGDYNTAMLKVSLEEKQMKLEFVPVQVRQGEPAIADGDTSERILRYLKQASSLFDQPLRSPAVLDARLRLAAPSAPNKTLPTEPFISYPTPQN